MRPLSLSGLWSLVSGPRCVCVIFFAHAPSRPRGAPRLRLSFSLESCMHVELPILLPEEFCAVQWAESVHRARDWKRGMSSWIKVTVVLHSLEPPRFGLCHPYSNALIAVYKVGYDIINMMQVPLCKN